MERDILIQQFENRMPAEERLLGIRITVMMAILNADLQITIHMPIFDR